MKVSFTSSALMISNESQDLFYVIDRNNLEIINKDESNENIIDWIKFPYSLGIYSYENVNFILFVDEFNKINDFMDIYEIKKIKIYQITPGRQYTQIMQMLYDAFLFNNFYFNPLHQLHLPFSVTSINSNYSRNIFIWNFKPFIKMKEMFKDKLNQYIITVINGSIASIENFCLISRRSNLMCGARFWLRGADSEGNCANFIETESIIYEKDTKKIKSFLQVRGSIPLHWTEYPNLTFLPPIKVDHSEVSNDRYQKHFNQLQSIYQKMQIFVINLTSKKGREKDLTMLYEKQCLQNHSVSYNHIDTEQICGVFHWERLTDEINKIDFDKISFNEFYSGNLIREQKGIIRTNCADSIDRTNLTQCEISIHALNILNKKFESNIRKCWVVNGNKLANQIVGSNALKSEITLFRHRTIHGLINDAYASIIRYYYDNFIDGYRQDCLDCVTLNIDKFPIITQKKKIINILWMIFTSIFVMIFYLIFFQIEKLKRCKNELKENLICKPHFRKLDKID